MRVLALLLMLLAVPGQAAEWTVGPAPSDDPSMSAALVQNEDGHALFLWSRQVDGRIQVFAELHLGRGERFGQSMPSYRIDGGETVDTDTIRQQGEELGALWGHVGPEVAFWMVWTSIHSAVLPSDDFADWFSGREIEFSYIAADGSERKTRFPLTGAAAAVRAAAGLETPP
jgi:hypothetical protein